MMASETLVSPRRLNLFVQLRVRSRVPPEDLALAPLRLASKDDVERSLSRPIRVEGAGDARANGVYRRDGKQNTAARWRHTERNWLCILRDGSNWWIGCERAAVEDLYWRDATKEDAEWRVCPCDDSTHRHFRGSGPSPCLRWEKHQHQHNFEKIQREDKGARIVDDDVDDDDDDDVTAEGGAAQKKRAFASDECPICLCALEDDAARAPCGHLACANCLARARQAASRGFRGDGFVDRELRCPLCRAPFILAAALHVATDKPLLEAMPTLDKEVGSRERLLSRTGSGLGGGGLSSTTTTTTSTGQGRAHSTESGSAAAQRSQSRLAAFWCFLSNRRSSSSSSSSSGTTSVGGNGGNDDAAASDNNANASNNNAAAVRPVNRSNSFNRRANSFTHRANSTNNASPPPPPRQPAAQDTSGARSLSFSDYLLSRRSL